MHRPVAKCQGQTAKAGSMLHDVKGEVEADKHKVCYILAVGFVWHVLGLVTDAKISSDSQSEQWLSLNIRKASLCSYMVECLETQVLRQQGSKLVRSVDSMWR
jgi:hypothetical protein